MKVHLKQIPEEGLHIEGEEDAAMLKLVDPSVKCAGPIRYSLDVGFSGSGLFATGTLGADLEVECVRCLAEFRYPLRVEDFAMQTELVGAETVDLTPFVREDILLALPAHPRCDWDGRKVCEGAPKGRACLKKRREPISQAAGAWGELEKLKPRKKR